MSYGYYNSFNRSPYYAPNINFRASGDNATNPIDNMQKSIEDSVSIFVDKVEEEKKKKSNKTAIAVGSSVLLLSTLVAVLNPKNSSKLMSKLKNWQQIAGSKLDKNKNNYLKSKFHKTTAKALGWGIKTLEFSNNFNSAKDIAFKWLCTEEKAFLNIRNQNNRKFLKKMDSGFRKIVTKPYNAITNWFDSIGKRTVNIKYESSLKKLDELETLLNKYKNKLTPEQIREIDTTLAEIKKKREFFSKQNVSSRLTEQEKLMEHLERDFMKKYRSYRNGFTNQWLDKSNHIGKNMTFWAEEIMMPTRNKVEKRGLNAVETLFGNQKDKKGLYEEVFEKISPKLTEDEKANLQKILTKANEKLKKANHTECVEYFDKKRDLVLGGAPTDMLTAIVGLGASGALIATADSKDERISRAITGGFPVVAGVGASIAFTAMLFSGVQGLLLGALTSIGLSKLGSMVDKHLLGNKMADIDVQQKPTDNNPFATKEAKYA